MIQIMRYLNKNKIGTDGRNMKEPRSNVNWKGLLTL